MPKRTRDDFLSFHRLCATIDEIAAEATPWQVATRCASAMADALQAHAVVIHQHDAFRRELRSIGVHGPNAGDLLGTTTNVDDDHVVTAVLANEKPLTLRFDGALPRFVPDRHRLLGTSRSLAVFPVVGAAGCVAVIEIAGVAEERQQSVSDACELVAQRFVAALTPDEPPTARQTTLSVPPHGRAYLRAVDPPRAVDAPRRSDPDALNAAPATFPKRAPTLLCRRTR